jgi:hypothetical protein
MGVDLKIDFHQAEDFKGEADSLFPQEFRQKEDCCSP